MYQIAIEFVVSADVIVENLPRGRAYLSDQLRRAALSIPLNIAEGAGEYAVEEKVRFYRMAKRSATECAGILDVCQRLQLVDEQHQTKGRELLIRIVSMLILTSALFFHPSLIINHLNFFCSTTFLLILNSQGPSLLFVPIAL